VKVLQIYFIKCRKVPKLVQLSCLYVETISFQYYFLISHIVISYLFVFVLILHFIDFYNLIF
jgi:hypothetical protein